MVDYSLEDFCVNRGISYDDAMACALSETDMPQIDVHASLDYLDGFKTVVIPYYEADGSPLMVDGVHFKRARRLGELPVGAAKYVQGSGTGVHVYLCPIINWEEVFRNPKIPIVITEGEAKAIALCSQGVACVALGGVSSIRLKSTGEFLPEARACLWGGKTVYVVFDSDAASNPNVYAAQEQLRAELSIRRGADVRVVKLPGRVIGVDEDGNSIEEKMGIDDFLLWQGIEVFKQLLQSTPSFSKLDKKIIELNEQVAFINDEGSIYDFKEQNFMSPAVFVNSPKFGKHKIQMVAMTKKGPVDRPPISVAKEWLTHENARHYASIVFKPGRPEEYDDPDVGRVINRWNGLRHAPGDVQPFLDLTDFIFSEVEEEHRDFAIKLMAYKAQNPAEKIPIALILVGLKGSGKSMWCAMLAKAFEPASKTMFGDSLLSDYNGYIDGSLLVFIDEIDDETMNKSVTRLKYYITNPKVRLNEKYRPEKEVDNIASFVLTTNQPKAVSFSRDERRYFVVRCPDKTTEEWYLDYLVPYFKSDCGPAIMDYLLRYDLKGWKPPAEAPMTAERDNAYLEGLDPVTSLAEQILTADRNVVGMWITASLQWAKDMKNNMPSNPPPGLLKRVQQIDARMADWPLRPFYSVSEIALMFPSLSEQLMGNRGGRYKNYTPEEISSALRTAGVKTLKNAERGKFGFLRNGIREHYLVIADVNSEEWKKPLTQAEFEEKLLQFGTYREYYR